MNPRTVLVPLDGSEAAEAALPYAGALAPLYGGRLALLGVVEREDTGIFGLSRDDAAEIERRRRDVLRSYLATTGATLLRQGLSVTPLVRLGAAPDRILATAKSLDAGLIVMGTRGQGGIERMLVGSVADKVMRLADRPVLLVPPPRGKVPRRKVALQRLLLPLDGSPRAEGALGPAGIIARDRGAALTLMRVEPWRVTALAPGYEFSPGEETETAIIRAAMTYLDGVKQQLPADLRVEALVFRGDPSSQLIEYARKNAIDLVVMATRGRGVFRRAVLGSTADRLVRSGLPVMLVR